MQAVFDQCLSAELSHYLLPATVCSGQEECRRWSSREDCRYPGGVQPCNEQPCNESIWCALACHPLGLAAPTKLPWRLSSLRAQPRRRPSRQGLVSLP